MPTPFAQDFASEATENGISSWIESIILDDGSDYATIEVLLPPTAVFAGDVPTQSQTLLLQAELDDTILDVVAGIDVPDVTYTAKLDYSAELDVPTAISAFTDYGSDDGVVPVTIAEFTGDAASDAAGRGYDILTTSGDIIGLDMGY